MLCLIQQLIGSGHQALQRLRIGKPAGTNAAAHLRPARHQGGDIGKENIQPPGKLLLCERALHHNGKLVTAYAANGTAAGKNMAQTVGNTAQHPVTGGVAAGIVDGFEMVHIQEEKPACFIWEGSVCSFQRAAMLKSS